MSAATKLRELADWWTDAEPGERANAQLYLIRLTEALGVTSPQPKGSGYEFEYRVRIVGRDGTESQGSVDLYKKDCFVLEAKDDDPDKWDEVLLRKAWGQASVYARAVPADSPPYLLVLDVGKSILLWDRWSGEYGGFSAARRIDLPNLSDNADNIAFLKDVWEDPTARDPRATSQAVTKEIAAHLAELAASLEQRDNPQEEVARFLMRCVFTMFAEDVGLLDDEPFLRAVRDIGLEQPEEFSEAVSELWQAMDEGRQFGLRKLLRFNGHFFKDHGTLPLTEKDLRILLEAASADWSYVEPSIFGTLLTRALDPEERHRLGAEFTPRLHVERVVRPTVEEPIRSRWTLVEAEVLQLREKGKKKKALDRLGEFHEWLLSLRFLDPACGSGNFLYVTMDLVKRIEAEVIRTEEEITGQPNLQVQEIGPRQFHGIEIKPWAREIAELTLWIGYHQFWQEHHKHIRPPEPVLQDTETLEQRDAVLEWDELSEDPDKASPDPTPRIKHPVTGDLVPDPEAKLPYWIHQNARQAEWPEADFIIGNPPYMGRGRQRDEFGDGYVDALRGAYPRVNENADYVMFWWYRAAQAVAGGALRAGLITTNTITQTHNRDVVREVTSDGVKVIWAIPDHPWIDEKGSAAVRVAMTVIGKGTEKATLQLIDSEGRLGTTVHADKLNSDLTAGIDVALAAAKPLIANRALASQGFTLVGSGFLLDPEEAQSLKKLDENNGEVIRPYLSGADLTRRPRKQHVIDFGLRSQEQAKCYPTLFDVVRDRVRPARQANKRKLYREAWWRFGETRSGFRKAAAGLERYIATVETSKHRFFVFLDAEVACSHAVVVVAMADAYSLGVLSSAIHVAWTLAAGGTLEDRPRYQKTLCFDSFPFPGGAGDSRESVADVADRISLHRKKALTDTKVTMTGLYNVVEKLRSGEDLTAKEKDIHIVGACGVLRDLHDELDAAVAAAYGWPWPMEESEVLERLVALHGERVLEEKAGHVQWLRPEYQAPLLGQDLPSSNEFELLPKAVEASETVVKWPTTTIDQIAAIQEALAGSPHAVEGVAAQFKGARRDLVERHLETLVLMGEARKADDGQYHSVPN